MATDKSTPTPTPQEPQKLPPVKMSPLVQWGFKYHSVVILLVCLLAAFGIYSLDKMNKNEFPSFTIREGVLAAVYPGATSQEMEEQVMRKMEDYIFSFKEVNKTKTRSNATDGMVMTFIELDDNVTDTDQFWAKFNLGLDGLKRELPAGVLGMELVSNFGETSSILLTMQSDSKTYREMRTYMDDLKDCLRSISSIGSMTVYGMQDEQIAVTIDTERLSRYALDEKMVAATLFSQGFKTTGGAVRSHTYTSPIMVEKPINSVREIRDLIVVALPTGETVRLSDIATVERVYPEASSYITNNSTKCILLSIGMKDGNNVVEMGRQVDKRLAEFEQTLPDDVTLFKITNQPEVVNASVWNFMTELLIAVVAVVIAIMLLLPLRVALIAASTIPITIFISIALFYLLGFELNTVTLAVLIVSLGMIVDNSVVIIDDYVELLAEGKTPREATIRSASEFFKSIFSATLAISVTFFPFLITVTGMFRDFLNDFPWAISIILVGSFFIAELLVPFLQYAIIKPKVAARLYGTGNTGGKKHFSLLRYLQGGYNKAIAWCFRAPWITLLIAFALVGIGGWMMLKRPMQMMPIAERNQFAVEIYLPTGTPVERTAEVSDSLERILRADSRVVSVANFNGCSSPRFQDTYAPQVGGPNFAQFIVNTESNKATVEVLNEYTPKYEAYFPDAVVRFKQLSYSNAAYPVEVRVHGSEMADIQAVSDTILSIMRADPSLTIVRSSLNTPSMATLIKPDPVKMSRLGMSTTGLELDMAMRYSQGVPVGTVWDGDYPTSVVIKTTTSDSASASTLPDSRIRSLALSDVTLRQVADVVPSPGYGELTHLGGIRTVYLMAGVERGENTMAVTDRLISRISELPLPDGVSITYGGEYENTNEVLPQIMGALSMSVVIIFLILLFHYKRVGATLIILFSIVFCIPGTGIGLWLEGVPLSITCVLGIISLMGILVRNVIIMIDYSDELQRSEGYNLKDAIFESARRRMRPIFLTSAAASMGVIPMMLGKSPLWMPMGTVIFWGTIITFIFIVFAVPVLYWKMMEHVFKSGDISNENSDDTVNADSSAASTPTAISATSVNPSPTPSAK